MPRPARRALLLALLAPACARAEPGPGAQAAGGGAPAAPPQIERVTIGEGGPAFELVRVPEGGFWLGRAEVTWDEYLLYCNFDNSAPQGVDAVARPSKPLDTHPYDRRWGLGRRPAVGMSWTAARGYCEWLAARTGRPFRLPTEAEWELACAAPPGPLDAHAWHAGNSGGRTQEVGKRLPDARGFHDLLGNLWEYCANPADPAQPEVAVLRGGSWRDPASALSPAARLVFDEDWVLRDPNFPPGVWWVPEGDHLGFRVLLPESPR